MNATFASLLAAGIITAIWCAYWIGYTRGLNKANRMASSILQWRTR